MEINREYFLCICCWEFDVCSNMYETIY